MAGRGHISGGDCIQIPWVRNPMKRLYPGIFSFHFRNLIYANGRKASYLCFEVKGVQYYSSFTVSFHRGVFRNQVYENKSYHAELCFLSWFKANKLSPGEHYYVTWFLSWSPCARCAEETANFLKQHRNVTLCVFAARLYYFWHPAFQQGLRKLHCLGAQSLTTVGKTLCTIGTCVSGVGRKCVKIIHLCPHGLRKSSAAELVSLCQTRGDNFRVPRKIQEFVLQKKRMSPG